MEVLNKPETEGKTTAVISYITIIGWIIAYILNNNKPSSLASWHLRQSLLINLIMLAISVVQGILALLPIIGWIINALLGFFSLVLFAFLIVGIVYAAKGEKKTLPVIGDYAQRIFAGIE
jgi:uncharacterized membrane protein